MPICFVMHELRLAACFGMLPGLRLTSNGTEDRGRRTEVHQGFFLSVFPQDFSIIILYQYYHPSVVFHYDFPQALHIRAFHELRREPVAKVACPAPASMTRAIWPPLSALRRQLCAGNALRIVSPACFRPRRPCQLISGPSIAHGRRRTNGSFRSGNLPAFGAPGRGRVIRVVFVASTRRPVIPPKLTVKAEVADWQPRATKRHWCSEH
jgi:hypothetical protein